MVLCHMVTAQWDGSNPWVIASMLIGLVFLILFPIVESRVESPMFRLDLFKNRMFSYANGAGLLSALR